MHSRPSATPIDSLPRRHTGTPRLRLAQFDSRLFAAGPSAENLFVQESARLFRAGVCVMALAAAMGMALFILDGQGGLLQLAYLFGGFAVSAMFAFVIVETQGLHGRYTMDFDVAGPQKSHQIAVPRIGGLAVVFAVLFVCLLHWMNHAASTNNKVDTWVSTLWLLILCALPAFAAGLLEDITKRVGVGTRLVATFLSGLLAVWLLDASLPRLDIPLIDRVMALPAVGIAVTVFAVGGLANSVNIIDGLNGLASGVAVFASLGMAALAVVLGDTLLLMLSLTLVSVVGGFLIFNYPHGRLFLGDGGAYFMGFYLAELAVLACVRHPGLSAWTLLTVLSYPVVEVIVSIVRRRLRKAPAGSPDRGHLHQQAQRFMHQFLWGLRPDATTSVNSQVSPFVWLLNLLNIALALVCHGSAVRAFSGFGISAILYLVIYALLCIANGRESVFVSAAKRSGFIPPRERELAADVDQRHVRSS